MLAALLTALFIMLFGGGASYGKQYEKTITDVRKKVEQTIDQKARREQVLAHVDAIGRTTKSYDKKLNATASEIADLVKHEKGVREKLSGKLDSLAAAREEALLKILDQRFQMKELTSRAEWEKIFR